MHRRSNITKFKKPLRLYWHENYAPKPPKVLAAIDKAYQESKQVINLYPGELYQEVVNLIAKKFKLEKDQVILGHGIEGLIHLTSRTLLGPKKIGAMFKPSFFVFENNLKRYKYLTYPCHYQKKVNVKAFIKKISKTDIFFLASPNTATGNYLLNHDEIEHVLKNYSGLFVVDECYFGVGNITVVDLLKKYKNLLVFRGVTKVVGLGGIRLAFALGNKKIIDRLKYQFTELEWDPINTLSLNIFKYTFPYFDQLAKNTRQFFIDFLNYLKSEFPNDRFIHNQTNFQYMDLSNYKTPAYKIINYMNKHGFLLSDSNLKDNSVLHFPEMLELPAPPKQYWPDFAKTLKKALNQ